MEGDEGGGGETEGLRKKQERERERERERGRKPYYSRLRSINCRFRYLAISR
jgi:hypothetical protein